METRFKKKAKIFDIGVAAVAAILSVGMMLFGVFFYGLKETWPELVLNLFYIACLVMMGLYFFNRLDTQRFNYWSSLCVGMTILLRDILFPPPLAYYWIHLSCFTLSVLLVMMLTYFYARKDWQSYSKGNLWLIFVVDALIATLYNIDIYMEPFDEFTYYFLTEIWIRPTITYGMVACFVTEKAEQEDMDENESPTAD